MSDKRLVILFDGDCVLCNATIRTLRRFDRHHRLMYRPLDAVADHEAIHQSPDSLIVKFRGEIYYRSQAVFIVLKELPWWVRWLRIFRILPLRFTDKLYDWVARNRYRLGKLSEKDKC